ncbi:uncharacterized protein B0T15DRAFT_537751 [Chaetomium strumarium]|uniref:Uncharacterized protein n=1 Tax=Chaetomium strumarium TaxID=1170767 RepID=A0AAJ0GRM1_9PEZI|nr:hypothetical protein B0T15DRAFT_537751 [Chaetomium strumarium]
MALTYLSPVWLFFGVPHQPSLLSLTLLALLSSPPLLLPSLLALSSLSSPLLSYAVSLPPLSLPSLLPSAVTVLVNRSLLL